MLANDPLHCGGCDRQCKPGETCTGSQCDCQSGLHCDDECMPVDDNQNCGGCGHVCPAGQTCTAGQCACNGSGLSLCGDLCVSLTTDEQHCGKCETQCRNTEQCGALGCDCPGTQSFCENVDACVSLSTDPDHCGACHHACKPTEICANSGCQCATAGQTYCASQTACTDTLSNTAHCGSCDTACRPSELCSNGHCGCPAGNTFCDKAKACVNLATDKKNCGACGAACPVGTHCAIGKCESDAPGQTLCGNVCYDLQTNADHCGTCDNDCGGAYQCMAGACKCPQPVLGPEVRLTTTEDRTKPRIVFDGTHVGVIYSAFQQLVDNSLRFMLLNPDGTRVPGVDVVLQNPVWGAYDLAWNGTEYAVVADNSNTGTILVRRIDGSGAAKDAGVSFSADVDDFLRLAWSPTYGGYVVVYDGGFPGSVYTRRIGKDGTSPEAGQPWDWSSASVASNLVVASNGTLGTLVNDNQRIYFERSSANGVPILPVPELADTTGSIGRHGVVGYDNNGFFSIWSQGNRIFLNLGDALNAPTPFVTLPTNGFANAVTLAQETTTMTVAWSQPLPNSLGESHHRLRLQRFTLPDAVTSSVSPITDAIDIISAHGWYDFGVVRTGPNKLLAVWADGRNGNDNVHDLYAAPIDLQSCP